MTIKRFHVRDGFVLDEHPEGSVVRYDKHKELVDKLLDDIQVLESDCAEWKVRCKNLLWKRDTNE